MPSILIDSIFLWYATFLLNSSSTSQICVCVYDYIYMYKIIIKNSGFCAPLRLTLHVDEFCLFVLFGSFVLRLEADGTTGEDVVAVKGFLSSEPWVRWVNTGGARRLPAPFVQCTQWGQAPVPASCHCCPPRQKRLYISETPGPFPNVPKGREEEHGSNQAEEFRDFFVLWSLWEPG